MKNPNNLYKFEEELNKQGYKYICGVDEAGRGPLAAGVLACACILNRNIIIEGIDDSKRLSKKKREQLEKLIKQEAIAFAYGYVNEREIDKINIYQASKLAMKRAIEALKIKPDYLLVDAMTIDLEVSQSNLIKGDMRSASIAAASILAKVKRDEIMDKFAKIYPNYGFHKHKGYPTKIHLENIMKFKPCKIHRKSYKPVKNALLIQQRLELGGQND
ncbi:MAG: ribonuclease HII [Candidatus Izimaplasma sp.]|nr:ribonuclease HII [Candidatus Izimaplasma bacterium]